jgi:CHAT domain-containing protein
VNLATLPVSGGRFLLEEGPVLQFLSSERDLVPVGPAAVPKDGILAIGSVDYDAAPTVIASAGSGAEGEPADGTMAAVRYRSPDSSCGDMKDLRFVPLPATSAEVEAVSTSTSAKSSAHGVKRLIGAAASEAAFKREADRYGTLHLATHAYFVSDRCASGKTSSSAAPGADRRDRASPRSLPALEDPLLWSGLALAGANRRGDTTGGAAGDDGLLTAEEIASLDLSGVHWAVLSACRTGVGTLRSGEGVLGLRRAFSIAGAGTLIMSLWRVEDEATSAWMAALYRAHSHDMSSAASVRQAGLDLLAAQRAAGQTTHPFFWGAFIAAGDWR